MDDHCKIGKGGSEMDHEVCHDSLEPWRYVHSLVDHTVLSTTCDALQSWISCDPESSRIIKHALCELYSATMIVDDIENDSKNIRRTTAPAAHIKFGVDRALSSANYVYFVAMQILSGGLGRIPETMEIFSSEMLRLHRGRGRAQHWAETKHSPNPEERRRMIIDHAGAHTRMAARLMLAVRPPGCKLRIEADRLIQVTDELSFFYYRRDTVLERIDLNVTGMRRDVLNIEMRTLQSTKFSPEMIPVCCELESSLRIIFEFMCEVDDGEDWLRKLLGWQPKQVSGHISVLPPMESIDLSNEESKVEC